MTALTTIAPPASYGESFARLERGLNGSRGTWLHRLRGEAMQRFLSLGFPTMRHEAWRYTNLRPLSRLELIAAAKPRAGEVDAAAIAAVALGRPAHRLVLVDGFFAPELSELGTLEPGVSVQTLARASAGEGARPLLGKVATLDDAPFVALNTALFTDGAFLQLAPHSRMEQPLHVVHLSRAVEPARMSHGRLLVWAAQGSEARVVQSFVTVGDGAHLTTSVAELVLAEGARVDHYTTQLPAAGAFHVAHTAVHQERDSRFTSTLIALGGGLARNEVRVALDGEGAEAVLDGLYLAGGRDHIDNQTVIEHRRPHGKSEELYKGILDGRASAVFNGKIVVAPGAVKTDARQSNRNVLLSTQATANTKPQLEIYNDDVRCAHGATVGQLDEAALFYLRSRGLDLAEARALLTAGFAREVIDRLRDPTLSVPLADMVAHRLAALGASRGGRP